RQLHGAASQAAGWLVAVDDRHDRLRAAAEQLIAPASLTAYGGSDGDESIRTAEGGCRRRFLEQSEALQPHPDAGADLRDVRFVLSDLVLAPSGCIEPFGFTDKASIVALRGCHRLVCFSVHRRDRNRFCAARAGDR